MVSAMGRREHNQLDLNEIAAGSAGSELDRVPSLYMEVFRLGLDDVPIQGRAGIKRGSMRKI